MRKLGGEVKAEAVVAEVSPAAVGARHSVRTVGEVGDRDRLWEQVRLFAFQDADDPADFLLDCLARLSLLGMNASAVAKRRPIS